MAYIPPATRERAKWRTLPQAVAHVVRVEGCQPTDARRQISEALVSGDLWPQRWEDGEPTQRHVGGGTTPVDLPPRKWSKAEITGVDWTEGTAIDRSEFSPPAGRRRCLLVHRLVIAQWWPEPKPPPAGKTSGKPGPEPKLRAGIAEKMLDDLRSGRRTPEQLESDTLEALRQEYGGSPNTAKEARKVALTRFLNLQGSTGKNFAEL